MLQEKSPASGFATVALAAAVAALTATLLTTAILLQPNPLQDWMFALQYDALSPSWPRIGIAAALMFVAFGASIAISAWLFMKVRAHFPGATAAHLVVAVAVLTFLGAMAFEVVWGIPGGFGNLSASNAGGLTLEDGMLTPHGWVTAARRSVVAASVSAIMGVAFFAIYRSRGQQHTRGAPSTHGGPCA
ncbi:MAG: hypothetical protein J7521_15990 [Caulobacter sp.]|nr:hypothetical protein [Caulobacter sp.]